MREAPPSLGSNKNNKKTTKHVAASERKSESQGQNGDAPNGLMSKTAKRLESLSILDNHNDDDDDNDDESSDESSVEMTGRPNSFSVLG